LAPSTVKAHVSTVRARYDELMTDNAVRDALEVTARRAPSWWPCRSSSTSATPTATRTSTEANAWVLVYRAQVFLPLILRTVQK